MLIEIWTHELVIDILKSSNRKKTSIRFKKMTISNFERLSGDIVQHGMSLVWWAGTTYEGIKMICDN